MKSNRGQSSISFILALFILFSFIFGSNFEQAMKKTLLILCCLYVVFTLQAVDRGLSNFYFSHITGENGLSQSNVKAIIQDSYGFMWFGTKMV